MSQTNKPTNSNPIPTKPTAAPIPVKSTASTPVSKRSEGNKPDKKKTKPVIKGGDGINHDLQALDLIKVLSKFNFSASSEALTITKNLILLASKEDLLRDMEVPSLGATFSTVGPFLDGMHENMIEHMSDYNPDDVFALTTMPPNKKTLSSLIMDKNGTARSGVAELLKEAVDKWFESANKYAENREKSAIKQLQNEGRTEEEIKSIIENPEQLRRFIQMMRAQLIGKLREIKHNIDNESALNPVTAKDKQLFETHKDWFSEDADDDDEFMPNDGAVSYTFLLIDIVNTIKANASKASSTMEHLVTMFFRIGMAHLSGQSTRVGWDALKTCPDHDECGVNLGLVWRNYAGDESRCIVGHDKQSSPLGRSPLRFMRMAAVMFDMGGSFSLYNAPDDTFMEAAVMMRKIEKQLEDELQSAQFSKSGDEGMSVALTAVWARILNASNIHCARNGRNDLSVPKLLAHITNHDMRAFDDLRPRSWFLVDDIRGMSKNVDSLAEKEKKNNQADLTLFERSEKGDDDQDEDFGNPKEEENKQLGGGGNTISSMFFNQIKNIPLMKITAETLQSGFESVDPPIDDKQNDSKNKGTSNDAMSINKMHQDNQTDLEFDDPDFSLNLNLNTSSDDDKSQTQSKMGQKIDMKQIDDGHNLMNDATNVVNDNLHQRKGSNDEQQQINIKNDSKTDEVKIKKQHLENVETTRTPNHHQQETTNKSLPPKQKKHINRGSNKKNLKSGVVPDSKTTTKIKNDQN
jgi:hypothetical protein